jgi:hypothetical protein
MQLRRHYLYAYLPSGQLAVNQSTHADTQRCPRSLLLPVYSHETPPDSEFTVIFLKIRW